MEGKQTLAGYDMVLALSQNTINYQFEQLHKRNIIHKKWAVLAGNVLDASADKKPFFITDSDAAFTTKLQRWISLQNDIAQARKDNKWSEIGRLVETLESEHVNFNFGWNASLNAPEIHIKDKDSQHVTLEIRFKSGQLYYRPEETSAVTSYNLKDIVYAFHVPIGQLKITKDKMIMDAGDKMQEVIRESGLSEEDFTIESLFLNFENANITTFDRAKSTFPDSAAEALQLAVENYFNLTIKGSENPYILGYGVRRKKIKASEKAMFQPSSLNFSTSYSNHLNDPGKYSAFNFLMMLNDTKPPTGAQAGVLPNSLIDLEKDTTSTTDGVFAIQNEHFKTYIKSLDDYVQSTFQGLPGVTVTQGFTNGVMVAKKHDTHVDDTIDSVYTVTREAVKNTANNKGITIRYRIEVGIDVIVKAWFVKVGEKTLSTSGQYTKDAINKKGAPGYLDFTITAGKTGRFDLAHSLTKPAIAFDENPNLFEGDFWKVLLAIITLIFAWVIKVIDGIINQIAVDLGKGSVNTNDALIGKLNDIDVLNQTNKVILPLGKIYTFKNLRMISDKDIVAYDIGYAPVIEK